MDVWVRDSGNKGKKSLSLSQSLASMINIFQIRVDEKKVMQWQDWDVQDGYTFSVYGEKLLWCLIWLDITFPSHIFVSETPPKEFEGYYMPRRALSPGMHAGLSVIMDVQEREYYCSATESVGFKVGAGGTMITWRLNLCHDFHSLYNTITNVN